MRSCAGYKRLEWFRFSQLARLLYFGARVQTFGPIIVGGTITRAVSDEADGDCTFDVRDAHGQRWHCEITPCAPDALRVFAKQFVIGDRVRVSGTKRWDPAHLFGGSTGQWEVHPVDNLERV